MSPPAPARTNRFGIRAQSPAGAPYLMAIKQGDWPKGAVEQSVDVALPRGVVVHGKITEEGQADPSRRGRLASRRIRMPGRFHRVSARPAVYGPHGTYRVGHAGPGLPGRAGP